MTKSLMKEKLAAIEHERWADWQKWMHGMCVKLADGSLIIPAALVDRWERQIATPYEELTGEEQQSDLEQVERYWPIIEPYIEQALKDEAMEKAMHRLTLALLQEEITRARVDELETIRAWVFDENLRELIDARLKIYNQPEKDRKD